MIPLMPVDVTAKPAEYDFNAYITRYTSGAFVAHVSITSPDERMLSVCEMRHVPATCTFTHMADGRTYNVAIDVNADGSATANFDVVENEVKIADATKTLPPTPPRTIPDDGIYKRLGVAANVNAPVIIDHVEPIRPPDAQAASISGIVVVRARINDRGTVDDVQVLKPLPFGLDQAAADAVRQWTFRPATFDGQPVPVVLDLIVKFRASDEVQPEE